MVIVDRPLPTLGEIERIVFDAMGKKADALLPIKQGAAVIALCKTGSQRFRSSVWVNESFERLPDLIGRGPDDLGSDYLAIVWIKIAEMMSTYRDSGDLNRPLRKGELGFRGGIIIQFLDGFVYIAYSGGTPDEDVAISMAGVEALLAYMA